MALKYPSMAPEEMLRLLTAPNGQICPKIVLGPSEKMLAIYETVEKVAPTDVSVLLSGESGTGKELVACLIHHKSDRFRQPFVPINCAALPETLLEGELFGYEKGAFTGAWTKKPGKFELANGGTLFLDEIADLSLSMQGKLLRVLEEREIERLGGTARIPVDVRVVSASNKDLYSEVERGNFREDLYYRLAVIPITLPPLRDRVEDIPVLARQFLRTLAKKHNKRFRDFSDPAMRCLMRYRWPGNIREMKNMIERVVILEDDQLVYLHHLPSGLRQLGEPALPEKAEVSLREMVAGMQRKFEKEIISDALRKFEGNRTRAARYLKISRRGLQIKIKALGLDEPGASME